MTYQEEEVDVWALDRSECFTEELESFQIVLLKVAGHHMNTNVLFSYQHQWLLW